MDFVTRSFLLGNASNNRRLTMYYCGIDLANKTSAVCVMDGKGEVVWVNRAGFTGDSEP